MSLTEDDLVPPVPAHFKDHLECPICLCLGTSWRLLPCQDFFCEACFSSLSSDTCPKCRRRYRHVDVKPYLHLNNLAARLPVFCDELGREHYCPWEGPFESRKRHIGDCGFRPASCPNAGNGCVAAPLKKDLDEHVVTCGYRVASCVNQCKGCYEEVLAKDVDVHVAGCEYQDATCTVAGCTQHPQADGQVDPDVLECDVNLDEILCESCRTLKSSGGSQDSPQNKCLNCLRVLFKNSKYVDKLSSSYISTRGGFQKVTQLLHGPDDDVLKIHVADWLSRVAVNDSSLKSVANAGGIIYLAFLLRDSQSQRLLQSVCGCLRNLARNDGNKIAIANSGSIPFLVKLIRDSKNVNMQVEVVACIWMLAVNDTNKISIANANAIPPLVKLLKESKK
eukprot:Rmarinus@m.11139